MLIRRALAAGLFLMLSVAGDPAAHAESEVVKDPAKDAAKIVDIVRVKYSNGEKAFRTVVTMRHLAKTGVHQSLRIETYDVAEYRTYYVGIYRDEDGKLQVGIAFTDEAGGGEVKCKKAAVDYRPGKRGSIRFYAPRSCFDLSKTVYMVTQVGSEGSTLDQADSAIVPQG
ncbi:hypothetical protein NOMA109596_01055 [Nocardioides marinus]|uniref:DUF4352 domain-containing protein n=1 Tax=Nocardioides marinus TaxID=374514 RepID=A0A7Z0C136_9ACTN|nr:hypothetical protein [Nocardioides marinus]NYI08558.1 hypothetical protein [Nocardioides marinus]